ncbi:uncharacterized protein LOC126457074 isoform X2 [Schistocerca serialis cubense]|nr:uncharacterized protein LOC126457074 isoform X2 [Schistocerca serialis cubense]
MAGTQLRKRPVRRGSWPPAAASTLRWGLLTADGVAARRRTPRKTAALASARVSPKWGRGRTVAARRAHYSPRPTRRCICSATNCYTSPSCSNDGHNQQSPEAVEITLGENQRKLLCGSGRDKRELKTRYCDSLKTEASIQGMAWLDSNSYYQGVSLVT